MIKRKPYWSNCELYYHCDYETFRKLKSLHKWYYQTLHDYAKWYRWNRKDLKNRKGPEPTFCKFFVKDKTYSWWTKMPMHLNDKFVKLYQQCRHPSHEPVDSLTTEEILGVNKAFAKASTYFA
jgi:hypothetical protein